MMGRITQGAHLLRHTAATEMLMRQAVDRYLAMRQAAGFDLASVTADQRRAVTAMIRSLFRRAAYRASPAAPSYASVARSY